MDRLRQMSVRLAQFHVDPTCSPTRAALMTGRYSGRVGVWHTVMGRNILRADETTLAEVFRAAGYRTGIYGKWHLGDDYPYGARFRGFDDAIVHYGGGVGQSPDYWDNDYFEDHYNDNGSWRPFQGYCTDVWFREALRFIREESNQRGSSDPAARAGTVSSALRRRGRPRSREGLLGHDLKPRR